MTPPSVTGASAASFWQRATGSLKLRLLVASALVLTVGIGSTTAALLARAERDTLLTRQQQERSDAARNARLLGLRVQAQQDVLAVVARGLPAAALANTTVLIEYLQNRPVLLAQFDNIIVTDAQGLAMLVHDEQGFRPQVLDLSDRVAVQRALVHGGAEVSDALPSKLHGQPVVVMVQPVLQDGRVVALLCGSLNLKTRPLLAGFADAANDNAADTELVVSDAKGIVLAHPNPALIGGPLTADAKMTSPLARWQQAGTPVATAGLTLDDAEHLAAVAGVPGPDWQVWQLRSMSSVLLPLQAARERAVLWALGMTVLGSLLLAAALHALLRPLAKLQTRAEHLFDAELPADAGWPGAGGEIGRLEAVLRQTLAERQTLELANTRTLDQMHSVMASAPLGIALTRERRFERVSTALCKLMGATEAELVGQPAQTIFASNHDYMRLGSQVAERFAQRQPYDGEWQMLRHDGSRFWARLRAQPVRWEDASAGTIWTIADITEEITARDALQWAASHDPLTGLANRSALNKRLEHLFEAGERARPAALLLLDLDRFKPINDNHGHAAGDAMLRAVASAMTGRVRPGDLVVRLGGDEFAVLLERCPAGVAARVAAEVREVVASVGLPWQGQTLGVGCSVGVAPLTPEIGNPEAWLASADEACYAAKAAGRNVVRLAVVPKLHAVLGSG
jgi:diguanylate cyclase